MNSPQFSISCFNCILDELKPVIIGGGVLDKHPSGRGKAQEMEMVRDKPSDLVTTSEIDKYNLVFNLRWKLIIYSLCQEGLLLQSVTTFLSV